MLDLKRKDKIHNTTRRLKTRIADAREKTIKLKWYGAALVGRMPLLA